MKDKIKEYIENIEQLGADARYEFDYENYNKLRVKLESIEWLAKKGQKILDKIEKENKDGKDLSN